MLNYNLTYYFIRKNGAQTKGPLEVQAQGKFATAWGQLNCVIIGVNLGGLTPYFPVTVGSVS